MIAHGFVVVGLFYAAEISSEDTKPEPLLKWVVFVRAITKFTSMFLFWY
jgi:hypothetical protein